MSLCVCEEPAADAESRTLQQHPLQPSCMLCVRRGAQPDLQNCGGVSPLMVGAFFGQTPVVELLLLRCCNQT